MISNVKIRSYLKHKILHNFNVVKVIEFAVGFPQVFPTNESLNVFVRILQSN